MVWPDSCTWLYQKDYFLGVLVVEEGLAVGWSFFVFVGNGSSPEKHIKVELEARKRVTEIEPTYG